MSPVRPSGGESLQEMIDRYNRELMEMGSAGSRRTESEQRDASPNAARHDSQPQNMHEQEHGAPYREKEENTDNGGKRRARPEPDEPLYGQTSRPLRPEPREPLDEPTGGAAREEYRQGLEDIRQGQRDREQGMRDMEQARQDREQGMRDMEQAQRDREQGMRDVQQGQWDREQGMRNVQQGHRDMEQGVRDMEQTPQDREHSRHDMEHARQDLERGLEELREGLRELKQLQREYLEERSRWQHHSAMPVTGNDPFDSPAVQTAASPESQREQWLRDLEQGRRDLEQGLRDLEQGWRDREQGVRDYEQGLAEREYWLSRSASVSASLPAEDRRAPAMGGQSMMQPEPSRKPNGTVPTEPTVPGRVTAQSLPGEQPAGEGYGTLIVQVYTARRAEPVAGAQVVVTLPADSGERLYRIMRTDIDGRTPPLQLPVSAEQNGMLPGYAVPYANYRVYVNADKFQPSGGITAQIFSGITGILPVELIPGEEVLF